MTVESSDETAAPPQRFIDVSDAARELGLSEPTLYRAISEQTFPAVRVRGCIRVPRRVIDLMEAEALGARRLVDSSEFCDPPIQPSTEVAPDETPHR